MTDAVVQGYLEQLLQGQASLPVSRRAWLDGLRATGARVVVWNQQVSKGAVQLAHPRGLKVWVYTVNDLELANKLLDMGVDGLITNNTSLMWKALALRRRLP